MLKNWNPWGSILTLSNDWIFLYNDFFFDN